MFLFPFEKIEKGKNIILYGAGDVGTNFFYQIKKTGYCNIVCVLDKTISRIPLYEEIQVFPPEHISKLTQDRYDYILLAVRLPKMAEEMKKFLLDINVPEKKILHFESRGVPQLERTMYSISGEDHMILWFFKYLGINSPSYIDIGAHSPFRISNTALLYKSGGRGINIEANPNLIEAFQVHRPHDINLNVGIGIEEGALPFYVFNNKAGLSTFLPEQAERVLKRFPEAAQTVFNVSVTTVKNIIDKYCGGKWPDYMNIDIEGLELKILSSLDFTNGPLAITVEVDKTDIMQMNEIMLAKGYIPYCRTRGNITYSREDTLSSLFSNKKIR